MNARLLRGMLMLLLLLLGAPAHRTAATPTATNVLYLSLIRVSGINMSLTQIGTPIWRPVDFHVFSAPVGAAPDYAEFSATNCALLPQPTHVCGKAGTPHPPPYDAEFAAGVASQGFRDGSRFTSADFSNGRGVYLVWMTVPDPGATGSSHDFPAGPIIPQAVFPIYLNSVCYQNGVVYDPALYVVDLRPEDTTVDGPSHFAIFIAANSDFSPLGAPLIGNYEYRISMVDLQGNGWSISAWFTVI